MKGTFRRSFVLAIAIVSVTVGLAVAKNPRSTPDNVSRFLGEVEKAGFSWLEGSYAYSDVIKQVCDGAPSTENPDPFDPEGPLTCQCRVEEGPFVGINGSCTGDYGGIMSSSPMSTWDFQANNYLIPVPGLEYVQGACAPLASDPLLTSHRDKKSL
jgi:hypothetical protein